MRHRAIALFLSSWAAYAFAPLSVWAAQGDVTSLGDDLFRLRLSSGLMVGTTIEARAGVMPDRNNGSDIGTAALRFGQLFVSTLNATNSVLPAGSTSYIQNRNTLQSGTTAYPSSITANNLNIGGTFTVNQTTASISTLISSSQTITSQMTVSSASISTLIGSSASITNLTIDQSTFTGNVTLGDAAGDLVTVRGASFTFVNVATISFPVGSMVSNLIGGPPTCPTGFTRRGLNECFDSDGDLAVLVTSAPAVAASSGWTTLNPSALNTCTVAKLKVTNQQLHGAGGAAATQLDLHLRPTGSGTSSGNSTNYCPSRTDLTNEVNFLACWAEIALDGGGDFDFSCNLSVGTINSTECVIYLAGCIQ